MPNPPAREYTQLTSSLEELRSIVAGTAELPPGSQVYVRVDRHRATLHGQPIADLVITAPPAWDAR